MSDKRKALRTLPKYDPDNNIGAVDRVRFAMINNRMDALTADELEQFERWKQIDNWIRSKRYVNELGENVLLANHRSLRNMVMVKHEVSWDTAERDIRNAKDLFKPDDDHEYYRSVYIEQLEERAATANDKNFKAMIELAATLRGHKEKQEEEVPYDKMEAFQLQIEYNPEAIGLTRLENPEEALAKWNKKKSISDVLNNQAEDAELE